MPISKLSLHSHTDILSHKNASGLQYNRHIWVQARALRGSTAGRVLVFPPQGFRSVLPGFLNGVVVTRCCLSAGLPALLISLC